MFFLLANILSTFFVNVVKLLRVWQFGLGFTSNIKVMYLSIIYVCRSMSNCGVFYKKGLLKHYFSLCANGCFMRNSPWCMGVTFSTFILIQFKTLQSLFFLLCVVQNATLDFTNFHIVNFGLFKFFWFICLQIMMRLNLKLFNGFAHSSYKCRNINIRFHVHSQDHTMMSIRMLDI
jgi:hypothetical protein